jgi:hypothetical protein
VTNHRPGMPCAHEDFPNHRDHALISINNKELIKIRKFAIRGLQAPDIEV